MRPALIESLSLAALVAGSIDIGSAQSVREPLPLDVVTSLRSHNGRSPVNLSPNGEWLAHTYGRDETVPRQTVMFAKTGFPFAEGNARMQASLTNTKNGQVIRLGGDKGVSWAPVWSPDGQRVAFYADDGGEAGLWIWERSSGKSHRFPGVIVRPLFGFETPRWSADSRRILCKILPPGMTVAEANALVPDADVPRRFSPTSTDQPSVFVLSANMGTDASRTTPETRTGSPSDRLLADLAILDLSTGRVASRVERTRTTWYDFSPDQKRVAYSDSKGAEENSQQSVYDLVIWEPATGKRNVAVTSFRSAYGIDVSWSPLSARIAYVSSGQLAKGELHIVSIGNGPAETITAKGAPGFDINNGESPPLWSSDATGVYALGADGKLWHVDARSGEGHIAGGLSGHQLRMLVSRNGKTTIWSPDGGRTVWAQGRNTDSQEWGFYEIDVDKGTARAAWQENRIYFTSFNVDVNEKSGDIVFGARDQRHPGDLWQFTTRQPAVKQVTHLNDHLDKYELGATRLIEWTSPAGQSLRGALLLPPGHREQQRLPLVVWVYGGSNPAGSVNTFGLTGQGSTFNMQVLATRGYAVLFPALPLREGQVAQDLLSGVNAAVDAAIQQGYADPERVAVMGQSYGAHNVLSLITQTRRFKAAIISAAVTHPDLFAAYAEMSSTGEAESAGYYERGQGRMGGTPWQYPERYRENSPLFSFDRVETPLLIGQGEKDGRLLGSDAIYVALQRLGKKVEYRIYEGEGHVINRKANIIDFWNRRLGFLQEFLGPTR